MFEVYYTDRGSVYTTCEWINGLSFPFSLCLSKLQIEAGDGSGYAFFYFLDEVQ